MRLVGGQVPRYWRAHNPSSDQRLTAALEAQMMGYPVRIRLDPVLTPPGWESMYFDFIEKCWQSGVRFDLLDSGLLSGKEQLFGTLDKVLGPPPMEWQPDRETLVNEGTHWRLSDEFRAGMYSTIRDTVRRFYPDARVGLCKETHEMRKMVGLTNACCNCLR